MKTLESRTCSAAPESTGIVLALAGDPSMIARLRAAFDDRLRVLETQPGLLAASRSTDVDLVVIPWRDQHKASLVTTVAAIHASRHGAPVMVFADRTADCLHELVLLARAGASGVIVRDAGDDRQALKRLVNRDRLTSAVDRVTQACRRVIHERHLPLLFLCLEHVAEPASAMEFARRLRVSRRTLSAWAQQVGAKGVRPLWSKCRVLVALELIRASGRTLEHVAYALQFASSAHLHNTVRRYTQLPPRAAAALDLEHWCRKLFVIAAPSHHEGAACLPRKDRRLSRNGPIGPTIPHSIHVTGHSPGEHSQ